MTITKFKCDGCFKEVDSEKDFFLVIGIKEAYDGITRKQIFTFWAKTKMKDVYEKLHFCSRNCAIEQLIDFEKLPLATTG